MERIPDWQLERYALGELPPERMDAIRARVEADPALRARLAALRADDAAFLAAWPARQVVPGLAQRAARSSTARYGWVGAGLAAAAILLVVGRMPGNTDGPRVTDGAVAEVTANPEPGPEELGRIKGVRAELRVYRSAGGQVERMEDGSIARAGDLVQLGYVAAGAGYGVVLSIDGNGVVTDHAVGEGDAAVRLDRGGEARLVQAYELDDAPKFERFFLVTGEVPFDAAPVRAAAERLAADPRAASAPLGLPAGLDQVSFLVRKEAR